MERHSFRIVSGDSAETMRKLCLSTKFHTRKVGEITAFYAVKYLILLKIQYYDAYHRGLSPMVYKVFVKKSSASNISSSVVISHVMLWHCNEVVISTAQLHLTKPELRF